MISLILKTGPFVFAAILLVAYSCNKQEFNQSAPLRVSGTNNSFLSITEAFNVSVGAPIDFKTGKQWIENFKQMNGGMGKDYTMASRDLKALLANTSCVGICFYYAKDEDSNTHLLPVGINNQGKIIKSQYLNTSKGTISWETAQKWIMNDAGMIDARFFGRNTFSRLFKNPYCTNLRAIWAADEEKRPQLLLIDAAVNYLLNDGLNSNLLFEDRSSPCPPICGIAE